MRQKTCQVLRPQPPEYTEDADNDTSYVHCGLAHASQQMLHEDLFTDAVVVVEGQGIPVHRAVLAANSPVFKQMFLSQMREGENFVFFCRACLAHRYTAFAFKLFEQFQGLSKPALGSPCTTLCI